MTNATAAAKSTFPSLLKTWRAKRRLSQLELALESGVSQRHLSFLELGRARTSRSMIVQLSEVLDVPLRERNDWLLAAGFAPIYRVRSLDDPQMAQVMHAVRMMLTQHEPYPALAVDRAWNIRLANAPFERLAAMLGTDLWTAIGGAPRNLLRLFFHPNGVRRWVTNWNSVAPLLWHRAQREAETLGGGDLRALLDELAHFHDPATLRLSDDAALVPVMPFTLEREEFRVSFFTVISTFGTAQDVTTDELRIETMFPADEATQALFDRAP